MCGLDIESQRSQGTAVEAVNRLKKKATTVTLSPTRTPYTTS
jgi:hypothetical protein